MIQRATMTAAPPAASSFRLWLDLARAGNFPSVWSNVLAALVLSAPVVGAWPAPGLFALTLLAGSLAYAGVLPGLQRRLRRVEPRQNERELQVAARLALNLLVQVDLDGNGTTDMEMLLQGSGAQTLTSTDFLF